MGMRLDLRHRCRRQAGECRYGMTEGKNSRLAALRGLEESLRSHRCAQSGETPAAAPSAARRTARAAAGRMILPRRWQLPKFSLPKIPSFKIPSFKIPGFMRSRGMRRFAMVLAGLVVVGVAGCGALWYRLSSGPITLDFATDWLAAAIKENLGDRYQVEVGGTVLERDENGRAALRIRDIVVRDGDGGVVANAPRAEVGLSGLSVLSGHPRAESLNLVGAALSLRVEPNGDVAVFAAADKRPLARAPMLASAESIVIPTRSLAGALPAAQSTPAAAPSAASSRSSLDNLGALLTWLDSVSKLGLDGHDLSEIGLKSGSLTVEDQRNGQ